jgi:hypothetical protein
MKCYLPKLSEEAKKKFESYVETYSQSITKGQLLTTGFRSTLQSFVEFAYLELGPLTLSNQEADFTYDPNLSRADRALIRGYIAGVTSWPPHYVKKLEEDESLQQMVAKHVVLQAMKQPERRVELSFEED